MKCIRLFLLAASTAIIVGCGTGSESDAPDSTPATIVNDDSSDQSAVPTADIGPAGITATPLNAAGTSAGSRFEALPAETTGVDFTNPIDQSHPQRYLYASAMACGGVAIGDIDGDDAPDIYFTSGPKKNRLFRQTAPFKFVDITETAKLDSGDDWSAGATMVDIDNDGDLDIYVCNFDTPNRLHINNGDGTFTEQAKKFGVDFVGAGHTPTFCDYDRDGDLDFYLMTNFYYDPGGKTDKPITGMVSGKPGVMPGFEKYYGITKVKPGAPGMLTISHDSVGQPDRLVRNNGDGTFSDVSAESGIEGVGKGNSATWWDYNEDGWPDIYVGNDFQDPDRLYRNNGDGTFANVTEAMVPHTTWYSMGADFGDLDGDGAHDFAIADMSGTNHFKQKTAMGSMSDSAEFLNTAVPRQYMRNVVYLNSRGGRFMEAAYLTGLANSDWTWTVRMADFDNDGRVDVFFSNGMSRNLNVSDNPEMAKLYVGETEWDKHMRAKTPELREQNLAYRNMGDLNLENVSQEWGLDHVGMSFASATADFDRDGDLDLVVCNLEEPVSIYRNNGSEGNRVMIRLKGRTNRWGIGSKVTVETADGIQLQQLTPVRGYMASHEPLIHFGLGENEKIDRLTVHWPSGHEQSFKDVDANNLLTIVEPEGKATTTPTKPSTQPFEPSLTLAEARHSEVYYDDFVRQPLLPNRYSQLGPGLAWGDIDGDGDDDLWIGGARAKPGQIFRNDGGGKFSKIDFAAAAKDRLCEDMGGLWLDADSDGDADLYVVSGGVECEPGDETLRDRLYINDGKGSFLRASSDALPDTLDSGSTVVAADYDRDGDLDLFVGGRIIPGRYPLVPQSRLLRNDKGTFTDVTEGISGLGETGLVTGAVWSDADDDGWVDLLVTHEWGPVKLFRNKEGKLVDETESAGLAPILGWWNGIAPADVDNDGDMDYAVTNFGLNTKYHASAETPSLLYYGAFEGEDQFNIVEAEFEDGHLYPVRGLSCSSRAMLHLGEKFDTYTKFALADLTDVYEPKCLDESQKCEANTLESGVFVNEGGKFTFKPFPRLAQIAPGFGIVPADFDADGNIDFYLAQNFYGPQAETGRMAGGVSALLKGNGDGTFSVVPPKECGLYVSGDAKSLTTTDFNQDGSTDFVVGVNDDHLVVFEGKQASDSRHAIRLKGKPGNGSAAGSKVKVVFEDGTERVEEVSAGSGYLSQSSSTLMVGIGDKKIASIEVRWPDGKTSTQREVSASGITEIDAP